MRGLEVCEANDGSPVADLRSLPLDQLCAEARVQEANFVGGLPSQDAAGVELFRRAIAERDEAAWAAVIDVYRGLLVAQVGRQTMRGLVCEDDGFCVDRAFQRFWRATRSSLVQQQFGDLASILKYLKLCLGSVLLDEARARRRAACISIDDVAPDARISIDPSASAIARLARREMWATIDQELADESERLVAHLSFASGLTPRQIRARHPERFHDVVQVYRLKRNMIDRLRRSPAVQRLRD